MLNFVKISRTLVEWLKRRDR